MSGEDKLAFLYLWEQTNCGREKITVTATMVASNQGKESTAGRRRLKSLEELRLINVIDKKEGRWTITLADPHDLAAIHGGRWDGQQYLFDENSLESATPAVYGREPVQLADFAVVKSERASAEPPSVPRSASLAAHPPADVPAHVPPNVKPSSVDIYKPSNLKPLPSTIQGSHLLVQGRGGCVGTSAGTSVGPMAIGEIVSASLARVATGEGFKGSVKQLADQIIRRIGCRHMAPSAANRVATHVLDGSITREEVFGLLDSLDATRRKGELRSPPSAFFNTLMKRLYERNNIPVNQTRKEIR